MNNESLLREFHFLSVPISKEVTSNDLSGKNRLVALSYEKSAKNAAKASHICFALAIAFELLALLLAYIDTGVYYGIFFIPFSIPCICLLTLLTRHYLHGKKPSEHPITRYVVYGICYAVVAFVVIFALVYKPNGLSYTALALFCVSLALFVCKIVLCVKEKGYREIVEKMLTPSKEKIEKEKAERETERKARLEKVRAELLLQGVRAATPEEIDSLSYLCVCPVCKASMPVDKENYVVWHSGIQERKVQEVFVYNNGSVSAPIDATKYREEDRAFPARRRSCPNCRYVVWEGSARSLKEESYWAKDSDGEGYTAHYYTPEDFYYFNIEQGRLDTSCFEKWKKTFNPKLGGRFARKTVTEAEKKAELQKKLVKCVDCGASFSPHAKACPQCGCPIEVCLKGSK